jgi:hypothetical protein
MNAPFIQIESLRQRGARDEAKNIVVAAIATVVAALTIAAPVTASTTVSYQATYVEPVGGPNQSPFGCPPGTSCGSASISGIGHSDYQVVVFNAPGTAPGETCQSRSRACRRVSWPTRTRTDPSAPAT